MFTRYYLSERLPQLEEWNCDEEAKDAFKQIKEEIENKKNLKKDNEKELQRELIEPILKILGHSFAVEEPIPDNGKTPDFAFFRTEQNKQEAKNEEKVYKESKIIGDAKKWDISLDKDLEGEPRFDNKNPSYQITYYLTATDAEWAILTNGRKWRLYSAKDPQLNVYYEFDLAPLLMGEYEEEFKYFYLLFRNESFYSTAVKEPFLDRVYERSEEFHEAIESNLEKRVYSALKKTIEGFANTKRNNLDKEKDLDDIHEGSMIFLYRLIFVLYAESLDLLPAQESEIYYQQNSLTYSISQLGADNEDSIYTGDFMWRRLRHLFRCISEGRKIEDKNFEITAYNGRLFDPEENEFIEENEIDGEYIKQILERLALSRDEKGELIQLDYKDLNIRHLGSIYEGLLQHTPKVADQRKVLEDDGWEKLDDVESDFNEYEEENRVEEGEIYLENDKGERKETGSYYTPQFVVDHIIENTIEPKIKEKLEEAEKDNKLEKILEINVCDPAAGSGHFLTSATSYIAKRIIDEVNLNQYDVDEDNDLVWAKRKVVQNCIYGVDVVPLTVELAKLSLWFETLSKGKPLSFLDHHIKLGNSLIGSNFDEVLTHPFSQDQKTLDNDKLLFGSPDDAATKLKQEYKTLEGMDENTVDQIHAKEKAYRKFNEENELYKQFRKTSSIHTYQYFEGDVEESTYDSFLVNNIGSSAFDSFSDKEWFRNAINDSEQRKYFHWDLEFPKVFFGEKTGFDVIVGNPPYFNTHTMSEQERDYFKKRDEWKVYKGGTDVHYLFTQRALDILAEDGELGYITSRYWLKADHADALREYISNQANIEQIIDFGSAKVFKDAGIHTSIQVFSKNRNGKAKIGKVKQVGEKTENESERLLNRIKNHLGEIYSDQEIETFQIENNQFDSTPWELINPERSDLISKLRDNKRLSKYAKARKGMGTGKNDVFILSEEDIEEYEIEEELIVNLVRNGDIEPFYIEERKKLLYTQNVENIDNYPNAKSYLEDNREALDSRSNYDGEWYKLRRPQSHKLLDKSQMKIFAPYRADKNTFALDKKKSYSITDTTFITKDADIDLNYLAGVLNSKLLTFYYYTIGKQKGDVYEYFAKPISKLPIRRDDEKETKISKLSGSIRSLKTKVDRYNTDLLSFVNKDPEGREIGVIGQPVEDINELLRMKKGELEKLQVDKGRVVEQGDKLVLEVKLRFKPDNPDEYEIEGRHGYTSTEFMPALEFFDLDELEELLIRDYVPKAIDDEFAGFKSNPTTKKDILGRLQVLKIPEVENNETSLKSYLANKNEVSEMEEEIREKKAELNDLVYKLYDIEQEERKLIEGEVN